MNHQTYSNCFSSDVVFSAISKPTRICTASFEWVKQRSSPARGYNFGCVCSYMAGFLPRCEATNWVCLIQVISTYANRAVRIRLWVWSSPKRIRRRENCKQGTHNLLERPCASQEGASMLLNSRRALQKKERVLKKRGRVLKKVCLVRGTGGGSLLQKGGGGFLRRGGGGS